MTGFIRQVGGPLQSWSEHSTFTDRDTNAHPTRSGLIGMIASALGIPREQAVAGPGRTADRTCAATLADCGSPCPMTGPVHACGTFLK
ncbi:CRISPR-associated protein Cas5 [Streptomyces griseoluteus]|uniref:CRISPR-associated protein Cas5 n=1 Tax=Streptomyces griseoluteus TaxID=29306 RepID=UPI0037030F35